MGVSPTPASGPPVSWAHDVDGSDLDAVSDALAVAGMLPDGISEIRGTTTAWFTARPADGAVEDALAGRGLTPGSWREVAKTDWVEDWKSGIQPVTVGRITILPPWLAPGGPQVTGPDITLVIEPGMAFGTGHHETTTACLQVLQDLPLTGRHVVDIGTGTGVLALAARALGAASASAVDIDPEAVEVARENLAAHPLDRIGLALGSCAEAGHGDVVVANIITDKLLALAEDLVALVRPGGTLVASGIAVDRIEEAARRFAAAGLPGMARRPGTEWAVLIGQRTRPPAPDAGQAQDPGIPGS